MEKVEVRLDDGTKFIIELEDYDADEIAERINDTSLQVIVLGSSIIQRYSIKKISLFTNKEEPPEQEGDTSQPDTENPEDNQGLGDE